MKALAVALVISVPAIASADNQFFDRSGRLAMGFSLGAGAMRSDGGITNCDNCAAEPTSIELDGHIGGYIGSRLALLLEGQVNAQTVNSDRDNGDTILSQGVALVAAQYWITPQLWIKGGIGLAQLQYDNQYADQPYDIASGTAIMGAAGYEIFSSPRFAVDLQVRGISGSYEGMSEHVSGGNIGLGFNWY